MRNHSRSTLILAGALFVCGPAYAQTASTPAPAAPEATAASAAEPAAAPVAEPAPAPAAKTEEPLKPIPETMQVQVPVAPPAIERTYRVHRGFYLGLNAGVGYNGGSYDNNDPSGTRLQAEGFNLVMDGLIGYAPSPGFAAGGALLADILVSENFERDGFSQDGSSVSLLLGPFIDTFPNPKGPLHLGGTLGLAHVIGSGAAFEGNGVNATGLGFATWVGYVPWVHDHFSIGFSLRLMANFTGIGQEEAASTRSLSLVVNALHF